MTGLSGDDILDTIRPSIFRIETHWEHGGAFATGFTVARLKKSNRLVLGTAAHVLDLPEGKPVKWTIQQFDIDANIERQMIVETVGRDSEQLSYSYNKAFDVGIIVLPYASPDGTLFTRPNDAGVNFYPERLMPGAGTRVGWAGFSGIIEEYAGHAQLCYFEGVICATVNRADKHLYLVDGHSGFGVSGGPLWTWSEERNRIEAVGVMSAYKSDPKQLPGFCVFEPIEHIRQFLKWWNEKTRSGDESITT